MGIYINALLNHTYYRSDQEICEAQKTEGRHLFDSMTFTVTEYYNGSLFFQEITGTDTLIPPTGDMSNRFSRFRNDKTCITPQFTIFYSSDGNRALIENTQEFNPIVHHKGTTLLRFLYCIQSRNPDFLLSAVQSDNFNVLLESISDNQTKLSIIPKLNANTAQRYELIFSQINNKQVLRSCTIKNGDAVSWEKMLTYDDSAKVQECNVVEYIASSNNGSITIRKFRETSIQINNLEFTNENNYSIDGLFNDLQDGTQIEDRIHAVVYKKGHPETLETMAEIERRTREAIENGTILSPQD